MGGHMMYAVLPSGSNLGILADNTVGLTVQPCFPNS